MGRSQQPQNLAPTHPQHQRIIDTRDSESITPIERLGACTADATESVTDLCASLKKKSSAGFGAVQVSLWIPGAKRLPRYLRRSLNSSFGAILTARVSWKSEKL